MVCDDWLIGTFVYGVVGGKVTVQYRIIGLDGWEMCIGERLDRG